jgi:hypothetical protein
VKSTLKPSVAVLGAEKGILDKEWKPERKKERNTSSWKEIKENRKRSR